MVDGVRINEPVLHESEHYMKCTRCQQEFDMRDLSQVIEHEECYVQPTTGEQDD